MKKEQQAITWLELDRSICKSTDLLHFAQALQFLYVVDKCKCLRVMVGELVRYLVVLSVTVGMTVKNVVS